jgi:ubiquinone biosynthesis protein
MEFMDDLERLDEFTVERERSAAAILNTLRALYAMIFEFGVVHCDLHPGNVFLQGNSAVILDGGFTAALSPSNRAEFCDFFLGIVSNDGKRCARILRETATDVPELFDLARFESEIALLIDRNSGSVAETFQVARFVGELFDIMRRHGVRGSTAFTMAILSLLVFEGLTRIRFPDLAFQQEAVPFVVSSIVESAQIS